MVSCSKDGEAVGGSVNQAVKGIFLSDGYWSTWRGSLWVMTVQMFSENFGRFTDMNTELLEISQRLAQGVTKYMVI